MPRENIPPAKIRRAETKAISALNGGRLRLPKKVSLWARLGFFAGLFGLVGLYWQVVLTRRAIVDTADATNAMREANTIAKENSHRELRAYVAAKSIVLDENEWDDDKFVFNMEIVNNGQTPARITKFVFNATWIFDGGNTPLVAIDSNNIFNCHTNTPVNVPFEFDGNFTDFDKEGHILIVGRVEYKDMFGKLQKEALGWRTPANQFGPFYDIDLPLKFHAYSVEALLATLKEMRAAQRSGEDQKT